jgi:hypothetical protein
VPCRLARSGASARPSSTSGYSRSLPVDRRPFSSLAPSACTLKSTARLCHNLLDLVRTMRGQPLIRPISA